MFFNETMKKNIFFLLVNCELVITNLKKISTNFIKLSFFSLILLVFSFTNKAFGQINENFESANLVSSYFTGNVVLSSGTWAVTNTMGNTSLVAARNLTKSAQLQSATGSQITTPTIIGGVGVLTFYWYSSSGSGAYQVNLSTDNGATWSAATGSPFTSLGASSALTLRTITINNACVNKIQIYRTGGTIYIDNFITTTYSPTITGLSPASSVCSGNNVVITGTNFTGATAVTIGGTAVTSYVVNSAHS